MYRIIKSVPVFALLIITVFYMISCSSPATKELTDAQDALQAARDAGAQQYAAEEYGEAEELIRRAQELMQQGKNQEARELLEEARFKAISAKGKAIERERMAGMTPAEREVEARILADIKPEIERISPTVTPEKTGISDIFFDFDRSDIRADARSALRKNAEHIIANKDKYRVIAIEGYCDVRGTEEYNLALGQRRADAAKAYLVGLGVDPSLLQAISKGETDHWNPGTTEYAYQQNRRAHFVPIMR